MAAGRCRSAATSMGLRPCDWSSRASLPARGRLARALKAAKHQDSRPRLLEPDRWIDGPHQLDQLVVHDLDDLLLGPDALDQLGAGRLDVDPRHELLNDVEMNVGLEQRIAHLAQTFLHVRFGQNSADTKAFEGRGEPFLQIVEHESSNVPADQTSWVKNQ